MTGVQMKRLGRDLLGHKRVVYNYPFQRADCIDVYSDTDWAGDDSDNDPDDVATPDASHVDVGSTFSCDPDGVCG